MDTHERPIGIFDSGVGGLTVMRAIADLLPHEDLVYLGDTARVPYGNRGPDTVRRYAVNASRLLVDHDVKALVVACNTASAYALSLLDTSFDIPVIGVVEPVARRALETSTSRAIAVIGTRGTIRSQCYRRALETDPAVRVFERACPLFVPLAEEGWTEGEVVEIVAERYLRELEGTDVDTLILGCTHYPLLARSIERVVERLMGRPVALLDSASATAHVLREILDARDLRAAPHERYCRFWATDDPEQFRASAHRFFGTDLREVEHVDIVDVSKPSTDRHSTLSA